MVLAREQSHEQYLFSDFIIGLVFFGAPHNGIDFEALEESLRDIISRAPRLILDLRPGSNFLKDIGNRFKNYFGERGPKVVSVVEQKHSPKVVYDTEGGNFVKKNEKNFAVTAESGQLHWPDKREFVIFDGNGDHSEIAKLIPSKPESQYKTILNKMETWIINPSLQTHSSKRVQRSAGFDSPSASNISAREHALAHQSPHLALCAPPAAEPDTLGAGSKSEVTLET